MIIDGSFNPLWLKVVFLFTLVECKEMASDITQNIDEIDDLLEIMDLIKALDIPEAGLNNRDEMKERIKEEIMRYKKKSTWTAGKAFSVFLSTKDKDARMRKQLLECYQRTCDCLNEMDDTLLTLLNTNYNADVIATARKHQEHLDVEEYVIIVAGESSSGKSSLINLILGESMLPHAVLSTTSTICELKYGNEKRLVAHYKKESSGTVPKIEEVLLHEAENGQSYIDQLSPYLYWKKDRERDSPYEKIELFWPHELLKNGIVIADSPGIGESEIIDGIVANYLPRALCFIYVINSTSAGGIQKDRVSIFLH